MKQIYDVLKISHVYLTERLVFGWKRSFGFRTEEQIEGGGGDFDAFL